MLDWPSRISWRTHRPAPRWGRGRLPLWLLALLLGLVSSAHAQTFYVDRQSPSCSNTGPGTEAQPYCTLNAAAAAHKGAGVTLVVKPGIYREQLTVPASGVAGNPYVVRADGPGVVLDGADSFDTPGQWTPFMNGVWRAAVTWAPRRVFVDGAPIDSSMQAPDALPEGTFRYIAGEGLYVNLGGENPGDHATFVGRRNNAFNLASRSWVTIEGFEITRTEDRGIRLQSGCSNVVVSGNHVTFANSYGIHTVGGVNVVIENNTVSDCTFHGIGLTAGATGCTVRGNESFANARPGVRVANGIYLFGSPHNTLDGNRLHENQDSGMQIQGGSNDCVAFDNVSWNNGDHGFDQLGATGTVHVNDVAYGNFKDGFSIEGLATGTRLFNCIAVNNGVNTNEFNLWVDAGSAPGFVSDYNIFWNSTAQPPIKYASKPYASMAEYQAVSGQDAHSLQADPLFTQPGAGEFRLAAGSPAIDSGTSNPLEWPPLDADGNPRVDVPAVPNTGDGPTPFTDRGAHEYPIGSAPVAVLVVQPTAGPAPLDVTADGSGSSDPNGTIVSYQFDFGDGTVIGPQPVSSAVHSLAEGAWTVTLTVTDDEGLTAFTSQAVTVGPPVTPSLGASLILTPATGNAPLAVLADASASGPGILTSFDFDMGNGAVFASHVEPTATALYGEGSYTVSVTVQDDLGATASTTRQVIVSSTGPGPNLVGNPSFETGVAGWLPIGATIVQAPGGFDGASMLRAHAAGSGQFGIQDISGSVDSTGVAGTRYRFRAWVRSDTGTGSVRIRVREYNASGHQVGPPRQSPSVTLSPVWKQVTIDYVCEAAGNSIDFRILDSPSTSGEAMEVDNVMVNIVTGTSTVAVEDASAAASPPGLYPNPMRERGALRFTLERRGPVCVEIFDVGGRRVRTLMEHRNAPAAHYELAFDGRDSGGRRLGPGLYLYRVQAPPGTVTGRFVVVR